MAVDIIWEARGVRRHYHGIVSAGEFLQSITTVQSDPRFDTIAYSVLDTLDVTGTDVSDLDVKAVVAHSMGAISSNSTVKVALVVLDPELQALTTIFLSPPYTSYPADVLASREELAEWLKNV